MRDLTSPSEMLRQDARDQRMLADEQTARWCDEGTIGTTGTTGTTEDEEDTIDDRLVDAADDAEDDEWDDLRDEDDR